MQEGIVRKKRRLEEDTKISPAERQALIKSLTLDGCPIEDLGLDFTLPGKLGCFKLTNNLIFIDSLRHFFVGYLPRVDQWKDGH